MIPLFHDISHKWVNDRLLSVNNININTHLALDIYVTLSKPVRII
jgi:hypothetical protein